MCFTTAKHKDFFANAASDVLTLICEPHQDTKGLSSENLDESLLFIDRLGGKQYVVQGGILPRPICGRLRSIRAGKV